MNKRNAWLCRARAAFAALLLLVFLVAAALGPNSGNRSATQLPVALVGDVASACGLTTSRAVLDDQTRRAFSLARTKLAAADVAPYTSYPDLANPTATTWNRTSGYGWTSGFYPGALWHAYELTGDPTWRTRAERWTAGNAPVATSSSHDLGFMIYNSFGQGVRLTGRADYVSTVRTAAASLDKHYDPVIKANWSWSPLPFNVIIDSAMNLELLFWTGKRDRNAALTGHAADHARTLLANHVRPDGSTYHVVDFDRATGAATRRYTAQGYGNETTWSRGQAWALYGLTEAWRNTGDPVLRDAAVRAADWWLARVPAGCVPFVDFDAPPGPGQVPDSSAAAVAASGLLELVRLDPTAPSAAAYRDTALATVAALTTAPYLSTDPAHPALVLHASRAWTPTGQDTSLIYGDYYLLEALTRLRDQPRTDLQQWPVVRATASSSDANVPSGAVDGSYATRWSAFGDGQWLQTDLGSARSVGAVRVAGYQGDTRANRFDVLGSLDGRMWTKLASATTSGRTTAAQEFSFAAKPVRYVRYVGHGNTTNAWNSISEFSVAGQPGMRFPTAVRVSVDRTTSLAAHPVVVGMRVVDGPTNVGVAGVPVELWQTVDGRTWRRVENRVTDGAGLVRVTRYPTVPVTYQARFPGTPVWLPSTSTTARVTVTR